MQHPPRRLSDPCKRVSSKRRNMRALIVVCSVLFVSTFIAIPAQCQENSSTSQAANDNASSQATNDAAVEGAVVSSTRNTLVVRTDDNQYQLFTYDRSAVRAARTALRSYVNSWYWLSSVRTTRVFLVDETTAPSTAASFVACEDALSFAACEVELFSWHWAGIAMKVETNRTEQTTIRARIFLLLLLTRLQGSDSRLGGCCIPIGGTAPRGGET